MRLQHVHISDYKNLKDFTLRDHKTVQARILGYAEAIAWTNVSREEAEQRRGFDPDVPPAKK